MHSEPEPIRDDEFEAFLDGSLPESEHEALSERLQADECRLAEVELQSRIDRTLRKACPTVTAPPSFLAALAAEALPAPEPAIVWLPSRRVFWAGVAAAAGLVGVLVAWWGVQGDKPLPFFQATPLAQVYQSTLKGGFSPYYDCREDRRFAEVFAIRLGISLRLLPMPAGTRMLGLSYPGGLSRDTTAMLCKVDDSPVMVFVDRLEADNPAAAEVTPGEVPLHVFREVHDGLVFYEVSPLDTPQAMQFMALAESP